MRHAQLSPEARQRLSDQRRNSTVSSLLIALLISALVTVILLIIGIAMPQKEFESPSFYTGHLDELPAPSKPKVEVSIFKKPTPPSASHSQNRLVASNSPSLVTITEVEIPSDSIFPGTDGYFPSAGISDDIGTIGGDGTIPNGDMAKRCSQKDRLARLAETGGTEACDEAVINALRWLQQNQNKDGSWDRKHQVAMTGLALLAYLGHCETPLSEEFGETVMNATIYLVDLGLRNNGRLASDFKGHWCYEHAIATYALCECCSFSKSFAYNIPGLEEVTSQAVQWIMNTPNEIGGWNYTYDEIPRYDTSINAWHLQALKAAITTGLEFKNMNRTTRDALDTIVATQQSHGGFGYNKNGPTGTSNGHFTLTGAGTLCVQQHKGTTHRSARKGIRYLANNSQFSFNKNANLYEHYYTSQAMINHGGEEWESYNNQVREELLSNQEDDGSWPHPAGNRHSAGKVYNTCLATLILEVYYRYLPGTTKVSK
ncbi:MAG: hypothetical protein ACON4K_01670 [Akkermansiaceae bacterium]